MKRGLLYGIGTVLAMWTVMSAGSDSAWGHQSPSHEIARLSALLETRGDDSKLYLQRAFEYIAQGHHSAAQQDLDRCLELGHPGAAVYGALAKTHLILGNHEAALQAIDSGMEYAQASHEQAALYATRARIHTASKEYNDALVQIQTALGLGLYDIEWAILRSRLQAQLGLDIRRIQDLESAHAANASIVLKYELLDARIDYAPDETVIAAVIQKRDKVRWKSIWNLRLARIYLHQNNPEAAKPCLIAVIDEIDLRYNPDKPHFGLLAEWGEALALLGQTQSARDQWQLLQQKVPDSQLAYYRLERLVNMKKPMTDSHASATGE